MSENPTLAELIAESVACRTEKGFRTDWYNVPEKLMLIVTELSEAMEEYRYLSSDVLDWLQNKGGAPVPPPGKWEECSRNFEMELADVAIRLFDLAGSLDIDLAKAIVVKGDVNRARRPKHGKER